MPPALRVAGGLFLGLLMAHYLHQIKLSQATNLSTLQIYALDRMKLIFS